MNPALLAPLPFAGIELDRAGERREDPDWLAQAWSRAGILLLDAEGRAALAADGRSLRAAGAGELPAVAFEAASFLGLQGERPWFALPLEGDAAQPGGWIDLRRAAGELDAFSAGLFAFARGLLHWQTRCRYCGACGAATVRQRGGHTARCSRDGCGIEHYPRTDPAIIVLLTHGDRALLARQAWWPAGRYSTVAGFVEPGESLEDALRREVREETGLEAIDTVYRGSQPWPFPASLMLAYRAEVLSTDLALGEELEDARWFDAQALAAAIETGSIKPPARISVSHALLRDWLLEYLPVARTDALLAAAR
jgi:NAD+ diphosphatase